MAWYAKLGVGVLFVVLSPLLLVAAVTAGVLILVGLPMRVKEYKLSPYYQHFGHRFSFRLLNSPGYRFFNGAKIQQIPITTIERKNASFVGFALRDTVYVFPDFDGVDLDETGTAWQVNVHGKWRSLEEAYAALVESVMPEAAGHPVKLLVEREMLPRDLRGLALPECLRLIWQYEEAFYGADSPLLLLVPQSTEELYGMMVDTPDLCGEFSLAEEGYIRWDLYEGARIVLSLNEREGYLDVERVLPGGAEVGITHWHPTPESVYPTVRKLGTKGNVLVISNYGELYLGPEAGCPYAPESTKWYLKAE